MNSVKWTTPQSAAWETMRPIRSVRARTSEWPTGTVIVPHSHPWCQLVYAIGGVTIVETPEGSWVVPPDRAVWVPAGITHCVRAARGGQNRSVYVTIEAAQAAGLPKGCKVVAVSPLTRELILEFGRRPDDYDEDGADGRLVRVLLDQIAALPAQPLHLPWPRDPRALAVARALEADPADGRPLEEWAREAGASARTLARTFRADCGLTFGQWRLRLRLLGALERLAAGEAVTAVAFDMGYDQPSAFIAMFRRLLGTTPGAYFR